MGTGYPTPDAQEGDVTFGCIPIIVPNNAEFQGVFAAAIYGLYAKMSFVYFWRSLGTLTPELAAYYAAQGLAATKAYESCDNLTCEQIINCIEDDPDTALAIQLFLTQNGYGTGSGTYSTPSVYTANPILADGSAIPACENDNLFGAITQLVDLMNSILSDTFERVEVASNYLERTQLLISGFPALGLLPIDEFIDFVDNLIGAIAENYAAQYTTIIRDEYRCDLFCISKDTCEMDFQTWADYFMSKVGAVISVENFSDAVEWFITGVWEGDQVVHAAHAMICTALSYGSGFFGIDMAWFGRTVTAALNDPDPDWLTLCEDCGGDYPNLVTTRCQDALNIGTLTQVDVNHWHVESELYAGNYYCMMRDSSISTTATFKILGITNVDHPSGSENGTQTAPVCSITNIYSWTPGMIGAIGKYEYMFSSNVAFSFDIEVSEIGA